VVLNYPRALPNPARLIAAIIFIALVQQFTSLRQSLPGVRSPKHTATPPGGGDATERIGADPNNSLYFSGTLDDVRLYNRALSATEIKQLYNAGR